MSTLFDRVVALERAMAVAGSSETRETPLGTAFLTPDLRAAYDVNALMARPGAADAAALSDHLDELYGDLGHRKAWVYDDGAGAELAPGMRARGYEAVRNVVLGLHGAPPATEGPAEEVSEAALRSIERAWMAEEGLDSAEVEQLVEMRARTAAGVPARFFVAEDSALAMVYRLGDVAEITDVATHEAARGRGLARSVIALAAHAALRDGARDVVLVTDADDWMQGFYRRLGFSQEAGALWTFTATGR